MISKKKGIHCVKDSYLFFFFFLNIILITFCPDSIITPCRLVFKPLLFHLFPSPPPILWPPSVSSTFISTLLPESFPSFFKPSSGSIEKPPSVYYENVLHLSGAKFTRTRRLARSLSVPSHPTAGEEGRREGWNVKLLAERANQRAPVFSRSTATGLLRLNPSSVPTEATL